MNDFFSLRRSIVAVLLTFAVTAPLSAQTDDEFEHKWPPVPRLAAPPETDAGKLPPSVSAQALPDGRWRVRIWAAPGGDAKGVNLAGSFNNWSRDANPMSGPDGNGRWSATMDLAAGTHQYKFVVDGDRWIPDPQNPNGEPDNHGGQNSLLKLGALANLTQSPASAGDGKIEARAIEHRPSLPFYFQLMPDNIAQIRVRTLARDIESVTIVARGISGQAGRGAGQAQPTSIAYSSIDMTPARIFEPYMWWEAQIMLPEPPSPDEAKGWKVEYCFVFTDGATSGSSPETYGVNVSSSEIFRTPDWAKHAIWYQIFPERFRNGDKANDPEPVIPWTQDWFTQAAWEGKDGRTFYSAFVYDRRYGGDLQGVLEKLPYLKSLGINAIYFNPVFIGESLHKYDATSYVHIDDFFGVKGGYAEAVKKEDLLDPKTWTWTESDKLFLKLLRECKKNGIRVIIDGVFNHVGTAHEAFKDVKEKHEKSRYADWFVIDSWEPFKYRGWAGSNALPEFRKDAEHGLASKAVRDHIFAITKRWMDPDGDGDPSDGIDGWRLDVPNEVPMSFWVEWRKLVKQINPQAYITGEIWQRADQWLDGKSFDAVMNYEFGKVMCNWIFDKKNKITPSEADARLRELRLAYPLEATLVLQNLLGSHDTDRVASMAHNPDRVFDEGNRIQDNGPKYDNSKPSAEEYQRVRLVLLMQMTYVGAPMFFYGDEVGMWGADDPTCRKPMLWEDLQPYEKPAENVVMKDQLEFYTRAIALRNAYPALRTGAFQTMLADDKADVLAFLRRDTNDQLIVALNPSKDAREISIPVPTGAPARWKVVFDSASVTAPKGDASAANNVIKITVPPIGGIVLHAATPK